MVNENYTFLTHLCIMRGCPAEHEIEVSVNFEFSPEERSSPSYPGMPAYIEINDVMLEDDTAMSDQELAGFEEELQTACWGYLEEKEDAGAQNQGGSLICSN